MTERCFKTVYFPKERTRRGNSSRVTVNFSTEIENSRLTNQLLAYVQSLSSRDFRLLIGDPLLEDLEEKAKAEGKSFSNICLDMLLLQHDKRTSVTFDTENTSIQLTLGLSEIHSPDKKRNCDIGVTFRESQHQGAHGWYPYVEGFSATYVRDTLLRGALPRTIYDPFGGAGTTALSASCLGIPSFYSEINPFMDFVTQTKIKSASWAFNNFDAFRRISTQFIESLTPELLNSVNVDVDFASFEAAFPGRDFFEEQHLRHLLAARSIAYRLTKDSSHARALLLLACAANAVHSSNMTRRADLRRRRSDEYVNRVVNVSEFISKAVQRILIDVETLPLHMADTRKVSDDCRQIPSEFINSFDMAITSPPYLNGTNYFRNTKLELWLLGLIESEKELPSFCRKAITSGINNVSRLRKSYTEYPSVEAVACKLDIASSDKRIPLMVRQYFSDMQEMFASVYRSLVPGGQFFLDIGDSKFYGIHVPTDYLLAEIAESVGFLTEHRNILAKRYSRDKSELVQVELCFCKPRSIPKSKNTVKSVVTKNEPSLSDRIADFEKNLPYKSSPYNSRSWGHKLHSLCSYQGKLKPSIAHWIIREFVPEDGCILDPLGGVGTIAFEAALLGRFAISNDKSPLASTIANAKLNPPSLQEAREALESITNQMATINLSSDDYVYAQFGLNATVADYYHPNTLEEILKARKVFLKNIKEQNKSESFVWASLLHILHGNRPYALSRTSHPITPLHPKGSAEYKPLVEKVWNRIERALATPLPDSFRPGLSYSGDFRCLTDFLEQSFDVIATSPPFLGMRFDRPNWLRLWFCGWDKHDFHKTSLSFLERQQTKSMDCYIDFFRVCYSLLKPTGLLILHLGSGDEKDMVTMLIEKASLQFCLVANVCENVQAIEQHGIRDKGRTKNHHFLFLKPLQ